MWVPRPQQLTKGPDKSLSVWCGDCLKTEAKWGGDQDLTKKKKKRNIFYICDKYCEKKIVFYIGNNSAGYDSNSS